LFRTSSTISLSEKSNDARILSFLSPILTPPENETSGLAYSSPNDASAAFRRDDSEPR